MTINCPFCGNKQDPPEDFEANLFRARCERCGLAFSATPPKSEKSQANSGESDSPEGEKREVYTPEDKEKKASEPVSIEPRRVPLQYSSVASKVSFPVEQVEKPSNYAIRTEAEDELSQLTSFPWDEPEPSLTKIDISQEGKAQDRNGIGKEEEPVAEHVKAEDKEDEKAVSSVSSKALGVSAIRAQSLSEESLEHVCGDEDSEGEEKTGWWVRPGEEEAPPENDRFFRDLEEVRAWMTANSSLNILISSDRINWRTPAEIFGLISGEDLPEEESTLDIDATESVALGADSPARAQSAGLIWGSAALLSTLAALFVGILSADNLGVGLAQGVIPFEKMGLEMLLWRAEPEQELVISEEELYRDAVKQGDEARSKGRLIDSILAYELALEAAEGPQALEGLVSAYRALGDEERAKEAEDRLLRLEQAEEELEKAPSPATHDE